MKIHQVEEWQELRNIVDFLRINAKPLEAQVLDRAYIDILWKGGSKAWVCTVKKVPTSLCMARLVSKTKQSYISWYLSFTLPSASYKGHATCLISHVIKILKGEGAGRIWGKVSTKSGYELAKKCKMLFWGLTSDKQLVFDTPLYTSEELMALGQPGLPDGAPSMARIFCSTSNQPLTPDTLKTVLFSPLKFDLRPNQREKILIDPEWP